MDISALIGDLSTESLLCHSKFYYCLSMVSICLNVVFACLLKVSICLKKVLDFRNELPDSDPPGQTVFQGSRLFLRLLPLPGILYGQLPLGKDCDHLGEQIWTSGHKQASAESSGSILLLAIIPSHNNDSAYLIIICMI